MEIGYRGPMIKKCIILSAVFVSGLSQAAEVKKLPGPIVYQAVAEAFPSLIKKTGEFLGEFQIDELICSSSNNIDGEESSVDTNCIARAEKGDVESSAPSLFLALLNSGLPVDRKSEAGTSYITVKNLNCSRLEPKSVNPEQPIEITYGCQFLGE
jgi:hypothetical protein